MVAFGAMMIGGGGLTMGGLIACSILSGRILAPVAQIPAQLVQWANTKSAIKSLDVIWELKCDHDGIEQPITPDNLKTDFFIEEWSKQSIHPWLNRHHQSSSHQMLP
jgi:ATP-binding cassette subfamily C protein LapB